MTTLNTASASTASPSAASAAPVSTPPANQVAPPPPPPPTPNTAAPEPDRTALGSGSGTSKLKLENPGKPKPPLDTDGDDRWQTDPELKQLHLNQRDLFSNLLKMVRESDVPTVKGYEKNLIGMQEAFGKAESAGDYQEARQIHKAMQELGRDIMALLGK